MSPGDSWPFRPWVRVERGGLPESYHEGLLVAVDETGRELLRWGDPDWTGFLRSCAKMVQAIPLVESGAADSFALGPRLLAVCCASHSGELMHVEAVREVLRRAGVDEGVLHCGPHPPVHGESAWNLAHGGAHPSPIHNNCSGKHAGMLATCAHRGHDVPSYWRPEHPLQREIASVLGGLTDLDPSSIPYAVDGCGVPTFRVPVARFALAIARFAGGTDAPAPHREASRRLFRAMHEHAEMVGGTGRFCTELPRAANRPVIAKAGGEGFYVVGWQDDDGRGVGLAAKAASGDSRSRDFAVTEALHALGLLDEGGLRRLEPFHSGPLRNHAGEPVGRMVSLMELEPR